MPSCLEHDEWTKESFINQCRQCGEITISSGFMPCPFCGNGHIHVVPFRDHPGFSYKWLEAHGFPFIEELLKQ